MKTHVNVRVHDAHVASEEIIGPEEVEDSIPRDETGTRACHACVAWCIRAGEQIAEHTTMDMERAPSSGRPKSDIRAWFSKSAHT